MFRISDRPIPNRTPGRRRGWLAAALTMLLWSCACAAPADIAAFKEAAANQAAANGGRRPAAAAQSTGRPGTGHPADDGQPHDGTGSGDRSLTQQAPSHSQPLLRPVRESGACPSR